MKSTGNSIADWPDYRQEEQEIMDEKISCIGCGEMFKTEDTVNGLCNEFCFENFRIINISEKDLSSREQILIKDEMIRELEDQLNIAHAQIRKLELIIQGY